MSKEGTEDQAIREFRGGYRFLSNFWRVKIIFCGKEYPTVEHAYQAAKTLDEDEAERIRTAISPGEAKRMGRECTLRPDWDKLKVSFMDALLRIKFAPGTPLAEALKVTGDRHLEEGNYWGDTFWGVTQDGVGANMLGKLLMVIRTELKNKEARV